MVSVVPRYWGYYYDPLTAVGFTVVSLPEAERERHGAGLEGRFPATEGECAIGEGVARARGLGIGDDLVMTDGNGVGRLWEVVGILGPSSSLFTSDLVVLTPKDAMNFLGLSTPLDLAVRVANPAEVETVARKVREALPGAFVFTKSNILATYQAAFQWRSGLAQLFLLLPMLAFAVVVWDRAAGLSPTELREVGILKAVGWTPAEILEVKFLEGLTVSVAAFGLGLSAAVVHCLLLGGPLVAGVLRGWSRICPQHRLPLVLDPVTLVSLIIILVAPYLAASVIPYWKAAAVDPDSAMR